MGKIHPSSPRGHCFILSLVDTGSRWVEAVPLKYTTASDIAECLFSIFCRMGFPDVILSYNGTQFLSHSMRSFTNILSIAQTFNSVYHPSSNGIVEKIPLVSETKAFKSYSQVS